MTLTEDVLAKIWPAIASKEVARQRAAWRATPSDKADIPRETKRVAERRHAVAAYVKAGGMRQVDMAERLGVSLACIKQDIWVLRERGVLPAAKRAA